MNDLYKVIDDLEQVVQYLKDERDDLLDEVRRLRRELDTQYEATQQTHANGLRMLNEAGSTIKKVEAERDRLRESHDDLAAALLDVTELLSSVTGCASYYAHAFEKATGEDADWRPIERAEAALSPSPKEDE